MKLGNWDRILASDSGTLNDYIFPLYFIHQMETKSVDPIHGFYCYEGWGMTEQMTWSLLSLTQLLISYRDH